MSAVMSSRGSWWNFRPGPPAHTVDLAGDQKVPVVEARGRRGPAARTGKSSLTSYWPGGSNPQDGRVPTTPETPRDKCHVISSFIPEHALVAMTAPVEERDEVAASGSRSGMTRQPMQPVAATSMSRI